MSITHHVNELQNLNIEIKRLVTETSKFRKRSKELEKIIEDFLNEKEQPGVKFGDVAIVIEKKPKFSTKSKKDKLEDSLKVLSEYGIDDPNEALDRLERAKKGDEFEHSKIRVKKLKSKSNK